MILTLVSACEEGKTVQDFCIYNLHRLPPSRSTFDLVSQLAALVFRIMDDWRRGWRPEAILLHLSSVPLLSGQHALATLPLIQVVPGLGKVHVESTCVLFVGAGTQADSISWGKTHLF